MFSGKISILKNIGYLTLLGIHAFLFIYFLYSTFFIYIIIAICSLTALSLITLAFYSFLTNKSYYHFFYIGIIICSAPIVFVVPLSAMLIVPELVILLILIVYGLESWTSYFKIRVDKQANLFQHDPAVTGTLRRNPSTLAFKMEEVWNPDSTVPMQNKDVSLDKSNLKMLLITTLLTIVYFVCSVISVYLFILNI